MRSSAVICKEILCLPDFFCLSLIPLFIELNRTGYEYEIGNESISHLFYMDDTKLFAKDNDNLDGRLQTVKNSNNIGIKFGLDKCVKATFERGRLIKLTLIKLEQHNNKRA